MNVYAGKLMGEPVESAEALEEPVTIPVEAYVSEAYARAEQDKLWRKVWQQVGRVEEIPEIGNYLTYQIMDDSIVIVRTAADKISAYHNVCPHRGRRLIDTAPGEKNACGTIKQFVCGFHGWRYKLSGENIHVLETKDCNWKVAMEAFAEIYHVESTHPEFMQFGTFAGWGRAQGLHSNIGYDAPKGMDENQSAKLRIGTAKDPRIATAEMQIYTWEQVNTNTTRTLVDAALRLVDELPEGTPGPQVLQHWLASARRDDEARGVVWPVVEPAHVGKSGTSWQIFPNFQIGHAVNNMLCYSARPYGNDPNKCIFEASVYELYPANGEPKTEWEYLAPEDPKWGSVLPQDFSNMAAVQLGMKSLGFTGTKPNPYRERSIANLHRNLARYLGTGTPRSYKAEEG
jgi:nitrite reductase/ring-hydroxylating ferredoxin subunit